MALGKIWLFASSRVQEDAKKENPFMKEKPNQKHVGREPFYTKKGWEDLEPCLATTSRVTYVKKYI